MALNLLKQNRDIKVLFIDIIRPRIDGVAMEKVARELSPNLKAILPSGYMRGTLREKLGGALDDFEVTAKIYRLPDLVKRRA